MSYRIEQNDNDIFFIFYMETSFLFTLIVCVGDGDGLYGEQWHLSGDR